MKKLFSLILAIALIISAVPMGAFSFAVSTADGIIDLLEFGDYLTDMGSTSKYWDTNVADNGETGAEADPIIIDSAEELVYLCKVSGDDTAGKYYKVADGIKGFNLANNNLDINGTLADNLEVIKSTGKNHAGSTPGFQGNFDGNGATVYGAWTNHNSVSNYAGLFTATFGEVTIKNINVNKAHFTAKNAVGGIVGYHKADSMCTVTIENCSITDSYLEVQGTGYGNGVGAILGYGAGAPSWKEADMGVDGNGDGDMVDTIYQNVAYNVKNCYVNLDEIYFVSVAEDGVEDKGASTDSPYDDERVCHGGVAGVLGSNALKVSDCVVIGIKPYAISESTTQNDVQHTGLETHFKNVYTTKDVAITNVNLGGNGLLADRDFTGKVFPLSDNQLKGAAVVENMNLDWSIWMADDEGYPELRTMHNNITFVNNGDGTHSEVCECGFGNAVSEHNWVDGVCVCGEELSCGGRKTIHWDGTIATGIATGSGTKDDPYIINTAAEFAWLIQQKADVTAGNYYKIADDIKNIILQPKEFAEDIVALDSVDEVQAFFEDVFINFNQWPNMPWESSCFAGNFDGNGATVYGLYQVSINNAGLFSTVDAGAVIKNIALKNSYLTSTAGNYQVGGLAAVTSSVGYGVMANGAIWFDSCVVANNYMNNSSTSHDRSGVIIGASSDMIYIDNCLVYGNSATYGDDVVMPIWSSGQNSQIVTGNEIIPEGLEVVNDGAEIPRYYNMVRNSIIMGTTPYDSAQSVGSRFNDPKCFENVYSDVDASTFFSKVTDDQIKYATVADLATLKLGDEWLNTTTYPELKVFHDAELVVSANDNGTHDATCSCGFVATSPCDFVDGKCSVCEAGLTCAAKKTIYWNGSIATGFASTAAGTQDDPIIISSASELVLLVTSKADVTQDKYFEIAEDIGTIVLQPETWAADILALESAAEVQALFEDVTKVFTEWPEKGWEAACFAGSFDGKGVKIYGLYQDVNFNAGLFSTVDAGAAIRNVAVLNSYMVSHGYYNETADRWSNYQVGAIAAVASNGIYGAGEAGVIWFDGCVVGNCYMRNEAPDATRSGVIFGAAASDAVTIDNCLVYGNDAKHNEGTVDMPLINTVCNSVIVPARVPVELDAKIQENANANGDSMYYNAVRNTIAFGTDIVNTNAARSYRRNDPACYENNYTDGAAGTVVFSDGGEWIYEADQIKAVTLDTLNENNLGDAWAKTSGYPELKVFHDEELTVTDNGNDTHSTTCSCGFVATSPCEFVDGVCKYCGNLNVGTPTVYVDSVVGAAGDTVVVKINLANNPGIISLKLELGYDANVLEIVDYSGSGVYSEMAFGPSTKNPFILNWIDSIHGNYLDNGEFATVTFKIKDDAVSGDSPITLTYDPEDVFNIDWNNVTFDIQNGVVTVEETVDIKYGDVNGDGKINLRDYGALMQYLDGWGTTVNETNADVNADGKINGRDYGLLMQYLNGWEVTLGPNV